MIASKLVIGKTYRHKDGYYATVLAVLPPKKGQNQATFTLVKCGWKQTLKKEYTWIKHVKPCYLEEISGYAAGES